MKPQMPDIKKYKIEFLKNYQNEFLKINNLKIGDTVVMSFPYEIWRSGQVMVTNKEAEGVLKVDKDGILFAESVEDMPFFTCHTRGRRTTYNQIERKAIAKIGTTVIY